MTPKNRNRGIVRLDERTLETALNLPAGQHVIGFRADPMCLSIDVCVEGAGLPEVPPGTEPLYVDGAPYLARVSGWTNRGTDLEEMVRALAKRWDDDGSPELDSASASLLKVLDEGWDPR